MDKYTKEALETIQKTLVKLQTKFKDNEIIKGGDCTLEHRLLMHDLSFSILLLKAVLSGKKKIVIERGEG